MASRLAATGLPEDLRIHDLRHTCAALLIAGGAHPKAIQAHLGHSSIQVTLDLYGHLFPDEMDRLAQKLGATHESVLEKQRHLCGTQATPTSSSSLREAQKYRLIREFTSGAGRT